MWRKKKKKVSPSSLRGLFTYSLLLFALCCCPFVSSRPSDSLSRYVKTYMARRHVPSIAALRITDRGNSTRSS